MKVISAQANENFVHRLSIPENQTSFAINDIIDLLESKLIVADLLYLDPPYGGSSSDYSTLYRFLEEYLYEDKLENL